MSYEDLYSPGFIVSNLFVLGLSNAKYALLLPGWSLDIELQFYLIAPLLLKLIHKYTNKYIVLLVTIISSLTVIYFLGEEFISLITFLPLFMIGMYIYLYNIKCSNTIAYSTLFMAVVLYLMNHAVPDLRNIFLYQPEETLFSLNYRALLNITLALLVIPYVTVNIRMSNIGKYDNVLSSMSYVIYLLHWPAVKIYANYVVGLNVREKLPFFIIYLLGCLFLSYLISISYDKYFEKLRRSFIQKNKKLHIY